MTPSENSPTPSQLTITRKRRSPSLSSAHKRSCPTWKPPRNFWVAKEREIPCYRSDPWDFYTSFVKCESGPDLVLCNSSSEIRVITPYHLAFNGSTGSCLPHIQHQNFIDIYEMYYFENRVFAISEYFDFSLEDLLQHSIYPTESEIAYIISQVLAGIRFLWSRKLDHQLISVRNIRLSQSGNVKIDPTIQPADGEQTSADAISLGTLMLQLMRQKRETLTPTALDPWSAEAINFVEACSSSTPDELSDHIFMTCSCGSTILKPLCFMTNLAIGKAYDVAGPFLSKIRNIEA